MLSLLCVRSIRHHLAPVTYPGIFLFMEFVGMLLPGRRMFYTMDWAQLTLGLPK